MQIQNNNYNLNFGQKYRVILTKKCPRACLDCINTFDPVISQAKKVNLSQIKSEGDDIVLTGGEPGIYPYLEQVIEKLKGQNPDSKMFIYSALANKKIMDVLPKVDGLSFTLHDDATDIDIASFLKLQKRMKEGRLSFVLNTPKTGGDSQKSGFHIRTIAEMYSVPCFTSIDTMRAYLKALKTYEEKTILLPDTISNYRKRKFFGIF